MTINENAGLQTVNLAGITSGATNETQTLTVTATSSNPGLIPTPAVSYTSPNATGSITFTPVAYAIGSATITVTVNDGGASNNIVSRTFTVTVNPVNQPPTLNTLADVNLNENAGQQTVNLAGITSGATNEVQTLAVTATSSNPGLIPNPTVTYTSPNTTGSLRVHAGRLRPSVRPPSRSPSTMVAPATTSSPAPSRLPSTRLTRRQPSPALPTA